MKTILMTIGAIVGGGALLTGCSSTSSPVQSDSAAISVRSCGLELQVSTPPTRAVTLEQGATEIMLALGLEASMIGTSYLTDAVAADLESAYDSVPVLADQYPTTEQLRAETPDFVYSMRASAFSGDAVGPRTELQDLGVPAYLSANDCEDPSLIGGSVGFEQIFTEIEDIGAIFDVPDRAARIVREQRETIEDARDGADVGRPSIAWLYSTIDGAPIVAGGDGLASTIGELVGADNVFGDLDAQWTESTWDDIAQRDPDVLVLADLSRGLPGDSAEEKETFLRSSRVTSELSAVRADRLVPIAATALDPSVRSIDAVRALSDALTTFAREDR